MAKDTWNTDTQIGEIDLGIMRVTGTHKYYAEIVRRDINDGMYGSMNRVDLFDITLRTTLTAFDVQFIIPPKPPGPWIAFHKDQPKLGDVVDLGREGKYGHGITVRSLRLGDCATYVVNICHMLANDEWRLSGS